MFHWSLAAFFLLAYLLEGDWLKLHSHAGYTVTLLVLFRLVWGVVGSTHARFADFVVTPRTAIVYLSRLARGRAERHVGHDPAGSAMIVVLLTSLLITAFTGMSLFAMEGLGPLASTPASRWPGDWLEDIHEIAADFTAIMVIVHVAGVVLTSFLHRENLIRAMITGVKRAESDASNSRSAEP